MKNKKRATRSRANGDTGVNTSAARENAGKRGNQRFYIVTSGDYDGYRIQALISGPKSPALSTMRKRFEGVYHKPSRPKNIQTDGYALAEYTFEIFEYERNLREMGYAGNCVSEWFLDWLLKTDSRFERVDYQEVNL